MKQKKAIWDGKSKTLFQFQPFKNAIEPPFIDEDRNLHLKFNDGKSTAFIGDEIYSDSNGNLYVNTSKQD